MCDHTVALRRDDPDQGAAPDRKARLFLARREYNWRPSRLRSLSDYRQDAANGRVIVDKQRPPAPLGADVAVTRILVVTDGLTRAGVPAGN